MAVLPQPGSDPSLPELSGNLQFPVGMGGYNTPKFATIRRGMTLDHNGASRVTAQAQKDLGVYSRLPVGPVEYSEGNIKKSTAAIGPAGYNQRAVALPDSPDDMSQEDYLLSLEQGKPVNRENLRLAMSIPVQRFLNRPTLSTEYPLNTHNTMNNLLALSRQKLGS